MGKSGKISTLLPAHFLVHLGLSQHVTLHAALRFGIQFYIITFFYNFR
jgi:hypothetical protein